MKKKCKYCFTKSGDDLEDCPVCKISFSKTKKELTKEEKAIRGAAINLHTVSFLLILGGVAGISLSLIMPFFRVEDNLIVMGIFLILSFFALVLGVNIRRYKKWCYLASIIFFSLKIFLDLLSGNLVGFVFSFLFLCMVVPKASRKLLYR